MQLFRVLILICVFLSCNQPNRDNKNRELLLGLLLINQSGVYDSVECQKHYSLNPIYIGGGYAERFLSDSKQYTNVAITDSTWDISKSFKGFFDPEKTQMNSVSGDTLCDFNSRFRISIKTIKPKNILVSTLGGNDFLRGIEDSIILDTFSDFDKRLRKNFPESNFVYVQVHRTKLSHVNDRVEKVTPKLRSISPNVCWVDPNDCLSNPVLDSEFLPNDSIHYGETVAFCIKSKIKSTCGVSL